MQVDESAVINIGLTDVARQKTYAQPFEMHCDFCMIVRHDHRFLPPQLPGDFGLQFYRRIRDANRGITTQVVGTQRTMNGGKRMIGRDGE